jgi:hypothetical protein
MKFENIINSEAYKRWLNIPTDQFFRIIGLDKAGYEVAFVEEVKLDCFRVTRIFGKQAYGYYASVDLENANYIALLDYIAGLLEDQYSELRIIDPKKKTLAINSEESKTPLLIDGNDIGEIEYIISDINSYNGSSFLVTDGLENVLFSSSDLKEVEEYLKSFVDQSNR